jgi:simple sugar transport system permease protein
MELYSALMTILGSAVSSSIAVLFPALGEGVSERAGVLNIGVEGYMIIGSITAYLSYVMTGNIWLGLFLGMLAGAMLSLAHAFFCVTLKCNQIICGTGIWLFGLGLSGYVFRLLNLAKITEKFGVVAIPLLKDIPFFGKVLFQQNLFVYIGFIVVFAFSLVLYKTPWGLLNRGTGDSPFSTDMAGHNVYLIRYVSILVCGAMSGLGGAYLAIGILSRFTEGMTAGRGFIAICIVIFGGWDPARILMGAMFFSLIDSLQLYMQVYSILPYPLLIMMPYVLTVAVVVAISKKARNIPRKLAVPYIRGEEA